MAASFGVFTSHPNLLLCDLHALGQEVRLTEAGLNAGSVAWYAQDTVLVHRYPERALPRLPVELWPGVETEALLYHATSLPLGLSAEENTQPFRFQRWLFAHLGAVQHFDQARMQLLASLPKHLQRHIVGDTDSEAAFVLFLHGLREAPHAEDRPLNSTAAARVLGKTARALDRFAADAGAVRTSTLNFIATNGDLIIATRFGEQPLYYRLIEGSDRCERCGVTPSSPPTEQLVIAHRRRKTVVITSHPGSGAWLEIPHAHAIAVDRELRLSQVAVE